MSECPRCGNPCSLRFRECTDALAREAWQATRLRAYLDRCVPADRASVAASMLAVWERPWSSNAKRFAVHVLNRAYMHGLDVLEETIARVG